MTNQRSGSADAHNNRNNDVQAAADLATDLVREVPVGMYVYELENVEDDRSLRLISANPASAVFTGVKTEEIVGRLIDECFPGLRAKDVPQRYAEVIRTGRATRLEAFRYGDDRVVEGVFSVKAFPLGSCRVAVVFEDISERRRVESMLRLTKFAVDHSTNSVFWMKPDGKFIYVNDSACEALGYTREELLSLSLFDIAPPVNRDEWAARYQELRRNRSMIRESILRRKDGHEFPVEVSVNHLEWESEEYDFCFVRDVTERRKAEREIQATNEQLRLERLALEEKNIAMREVLARFEEEKQTTREQIRINVEETLTPLLARLRQQCDENQRHLIDLLEQHLRDIASPFLDILKTSFSKLTPREQEICLMIKAGRRSKEIATMLNISLLTIHKHREQIRKKLGLKHTNVNLNSFLKTI
ncbi:MAG: PAS domain S-box protein [bacterium]|nr:PAS domain S-box protein [bacterium]